MPAAFALIIAVVIEPLRRLLEQFLTPFYQDLDGASRLGEVRRIARTADRIAAAGAEGTELDLILYFHALGPWLERVGNQSRALLALGGSVSELDLRRAAQSIRRLDAPVTAVEGIVATARVIDGAGLRGVAERIAKSRREGMTIGEIAAAGAEPARREAWMPAAALPILHACDGVRIPFCRALLVELDEE